MGMLRWTDEQLREYQQRHGRAQSNQESRAKTERGKYRNTHVQIDGRMFDSKLEGGRYVELKRQEEAGLITGLQCQVAFKLEINGQLICTYKADFVYHDCDGHRIVEDAKGVRTREYVLKKKLMRALLGIDIREFRKDRRRG